MSRLPAAAADGGRAKLSGAFFRVEYAACFQLLEILNPRNALTAGVGSKRENIFMPALPFAQYGLQHLYLFPYYQSREDYQKATGMEAPPWNPNKPPKYWFDPKARQAARRSIVYDSVLSVSENGMPIAGPDSKPQLEPLLILRDDAAAVNIPPKGPGISNVPGADQPEVQPPLGPLSADEELAFGFAGIAIIKNKNMQPDPGIFTREDRALLAKIAAKLGVA